MQKIELSLPILSPHLLHRLTIPAGRTVDNGGHDNLINVGSIEDGSEFIFLPVIFVLYEFIAGAETVLNNIGPVLTVSVASTNRCTFKSSLRDDVDRVIALRNRRPEC